MPSRRAARRRKRRRASRKEVAALTAAAAAADADTAAWVSAAGGRLPVPATPTPTPTPTAPAAGDDPVGGHQYHMPTLQLPQCSGHHMGGLAVRGAGAGARATQQEVVRLVRRSPAFQVPRCPVFGMCGGCQLQHINYDTQLQEKQVRRVVWWWWWCGWW